jgi:hypothetical protein
MMDDCRRFLKLSSNDVLRKQAAQLLARLAGYAYPGADLWAELMRGLQDAKNNMCVWLLTSRYMVLSHALLSTWCG